MTEGRVTMAERPAWEVRFANEEFNKVAGEIRARKAMTNEAIDKSKANVKIAATQEDVLTAVNERMKEKGERYEVAFANIATQEPYRTILGMPPEKK